MKNESMGLTDMTIAALRSCVLHADGLARRIRDFFPVARNRKPLVDLSKVITWVMSPWWTSRWFAS
jgi:hypothetical protein